MNSRQQTILQMVIDQGQVSVTDLAKATGVSEVTIRQDLNTLEKLSYLRRAHGFAVSLDSDDVETRMMSNYTLKRELAEFAASLVQPGKWQQQCPTRPDSGRAEEKCHYHHGQQLHRAFAERRAL